MGVPRNSGPSTSVVVAIVVMITCQASVNPIHLPVRSQTCPDICAQHEQHKQHAGKRAVYVQCWAGRVLEGVADSVACHSCLVALTALSAVCTSLNVPAIQPPSRCTTQCGTERRKQMTSPRPGQSSYFLALSHAPPALSKKVAMSSAVSVPNISSPASTWASISQHHLGINQSTPPEHQSVNTT